jgi:hypothetical protein
MAEGARPRGGMEGLERCRDANGVDSTVVVKATRSDED